MKSNEPGIIITEPLARNMVQLIENIALGIGRLVRKLVRNIILFGAREVDDG